MHSTPIALDAERFSTPEALLAHLLAPATFERLPHELLAQCLANATAVLQIATSELEGEGFDHICTALWGAFGTLESASEILAAWHRGQLREMAP